VRWGGGGEGGREDGDEQDVDLSISLSDLLEGCEEGSSSLSPSLLEDADLSQSTEEGVDLFDLSPADMDELYRLFGFGHSRTPGRGRGRPPKDSVYDASLRKYRKVV
jgi:hypothetical protein